MQYVNNAAFAIRTIRIYNQMKSTYASYSHTLAAGTLLNALSVIFPDRGVFLFDDQNIQDKPFPHLLDRSAENTREYLRSIRNGLSHKTRLNFRDIYCADSHQILMLNIASNQNLPGVQFTDLELAAVIKIINKALSDQFPDLYNQEYETQMP